MIILALNELNLNCVKGYVSDEKISNVKSKSK